MWGCVSQLDVPYEVRHMMRFKDKHQRPLTDREKEIIARVKAESKPVTGRPGFIIPNVKVRMSYIDFTRKGCQMDFTRKLREPF